MKAVPPCLAQAEPAGPLAAPVSPAVSKESFCDACQVGQRVIGSPTLCADRIKGQFDVSKYAMSRADKDPR
jgi:hypothetical protein